jgi:hypothetical protein
MDLTEPENVEKWAVETFGAVECGDRRRRDRLIKVASALASNPSASLPCALGTWGETLGPIVCWAILPSATSRS